MSREMDEAAWAVLDALDEQHLPREFDVASTGSMYVHVTPACEDGFTIRIADHGEVYSRNKFNIFDGENKLPTVLGYIAELGKREREFDAAELAAI